MKRYSLTREALRDLEEAICYVAHDNPTAARNLLDRLEVSCMRLGEMPDIGRRREELGLELMSFAVGSYVIFYRADDEAIQILRILHGSRDVARLFE